MSNLTFDLSKIDSTNYANVPVTVGLDGPYAQHGTKVVSGDEVTKNTDANGVVVFNLPATTSLTPQYPYYLYWPGVTPILFRKGAGDENWNNVEKVTTEPAAPNLVPVAGGSVQVTGRSPLSSGKIWKGDADGVAQEVDEGAIGDDTLGVLGALPAASEALGDADKFPVQNASHDPSDPNSALWVLAPFTRAYAYLRTKFATVADTGSYDDLTNAPQTWKTLGTYSLDDSAGVLPTGSFSRYASNDPRRWIFRLRTGESWDLSAGDTVLVVGANGTHWFGGTVQSVGSTPLDLRLASSADISNAPPDTSGGNFTVARVGANVQTDWNETSRTKPAFLANKPNLASVATSGSYNDLTNKPAIPEGFSPAPINLGTWNWNGNANVGGGADTISSQVTDLNQVNSANQNKRTALTDLKAGTYLSVGNAAVIRLNSVPAFHSLSKVQLVYTVISGSLSDSTGSQAVKAFQIKWSDIGGKPTIPTIEASPAGDPTATLTKLLLESTVYKFAAAWADITGKPNGLVTRADFQPSEDDFWSTYASDFNVWDAALDQDAQVFAFFTGAPSAATLVEFNDLTAKDVTNVVRVRIGKNVRSSGSFFGNDTKSLDDAPSGTLHIRQYDRNTPYVTFTITSAVEAGGTDNRYWDLTGTMAQSANWTSNPQGFCAFTDTIPADMRIAESTIDLDNGFLARLRKLSNWDSVHVSSLTAFMAANPAKAGFSELQTALKNTLNGFFARLDGSNLTSRFKNDVRSPADPYDFTTAYTKLANGAVVANAGEFAFNVEPTLDGDAVQIEIRFKTADSASAIERWLVGNELVLSGAGSGTYRLAGSVSPSGNNYIASVQLVSGGSSTAGAAFVKLREDTPHRDEFSAIALKTAAPTSTDTNVTESDTVLQSGCSDDDLYALTFLGAWSSETHNPVIRTVVIQFSHLPTTYHWISLRGGAGGARFMIRRNGTNIEWRRAGAVGTSSTAYAYKLN